MLSEGMLVSNDLYTIKDLVLLVKKGMILQISILKLINFENLYLINKKNGIYIKIKSRQ